MDQFYISYAFDVPLIPPQIPSTPLIAPSDLIALQSQSGKIHLSTIVKSYISSILIALRLDHRIQSTSISPRAVNDIRSFVQVMSLTGQTGSNVQFVPLAIERCVGFRIQLERDIVGESRCVLKEVLENVRAPF